MRKKPLPLPQTSPTIWLVVDCNGRPVDWVACFSSEEAYSRLIELHREQDIETLLVRARRSAASKYDVNNPKPHDWRGDSVSPEMVLWRVRRERFIAESIEGWAPPDDHLTSDREDPDFHVIDIRMPAGVSIRIERDK